MRTLVMGVLNVTPDSFYDGGRYRDPDVAIAHGLAMAEEGADIIDVGGESSRPGADPVSIDEELERVLPVVAALSGRVRVSIDTMKQEVAEAAIEQGSTLVNDVSSSLAAIAARRGAGLVVMHMRGVPKTMQIHPRYDDVVTDVRKALVRAGEKAQALGVEEIYLDPGIGFGKTLAHNLALLRSLPELVETGWPIAVGTSRKGMLGVVSSPTGESLAPEERFESSLASAVWAMAAGVTIVRVHDVRATAHAAEIVGDVGDRAGAGSSGVRFR